MDRPCFFTSFNMKTANDNVGVLCCELIEDNVLIQYTSAHSTVNLFRICKKKLSDM